MDKAMRLSRRIQEIEPFYVMEVAKAAAAIAREDLSAQRPMIFLNIGEPDFTAPAQVQEAAARAIRDGRTQYTSATGLDELRERISGWYASRFGVSVPARRIVITAGASAGLLLACLALIDPWDDVLMADPTYPCNQNFVRAAGGRPVLLPTCAAERFQLTADRIADSWGASTRGVLLASPANPTGTSVSVEELSRIHNEVGRRGGFTVVDEIYLGLSYEREFSHCALAIDDQIISINSFSKYFNMTGWRLGWLVVPDALVHPIERLAQNLFICPSAVAQWAAIACFEAESLSEFERRRLEFKARRDYFVPALSALGLPVPVTPDGAFYAWADCSAVCRKLGIKDSWDLSFDLMRKARVAATPGRDFGRASAAQFLRFSTANSLGQLEQAVSRMRAVIA